jgi:nitrate/nitrite transport system ATP-binding protein
MLRLEGVGKGFGTGARRTPVLRDVTLEVARGEFLAIVGPSGAGKTTLVSLIAGLARPDTGRITLDGRPVLGPGPERGLVFQNYSLLPWLTVLENVMLAVDRAFPDWSPRGRREHALEHIGLVGLAAARDKRPAQLSGGMRQRVSLARALAMDPDVLLLDEPLGALDALTRATLQGEIARLWAQDRKTVVMVTNDVDEALLLGDRVAVMTPGPAATLGAPIPVPLPRPRERRLVTRDPRHKLVRARVVESLRGEAPRAVELPRPLVETAAALEGVA